MDVEPRQFEKVPCTRCGGSGQYSFCQTMQGKYGPYTCFKCNGDGQMLTKRGAAAYQRFMDSLLIPIREMRPGQKVRFYNKWETVVEVRPGSLDKDGGRVVDGVTQPYPIVVITDCCKHMGREPDSVVLLAHSKEDKAAKRDEALDYQDALTKAGKPRKQAAVRK